MPTVMPILVFKEALVHMRFMQGPVAGVAAVVVPVVAISGHTLMPLFLGQAPSVHKQQHDESMPSPLLHWQCWIQVLLDICTFPGRGLACLQSIIWVVCTAARA